uniref:Chromosome 11 open reading frame 86 n=1 Tax=Moschus moschiferus TaxID=68415 RepID=A0A8C6G201_MOSMO
MGTGLRSQSLRGPRPSYGKLQEPWGKPVEGQLRRVLSLRQGHEKSRSSDGGPERLDNPGQERLPGSLGDTEQLIQAEREGSRRWLRQYQQIRRRWESFVTSFPSVTLSRSASPQ